MIKVFFSDYYCMKTNHFCENEADLAENSLVLLGLKGFGNTSKLEKLSIWL